MIEDDNIFSAVHHGDAMFFLGTSSKSYLFETKDVSYANNLGCVPSARERTFPLNTESFKNMNEAWIDRTYGTFDMTFFCRVYEIRMLIILYRPVQFCRSALNVEELKPNTPKRSTLSVLFLFRRGSVTFPSVSAIASSAIGSHSLSSTWYKLVAALQI